MIAMTKWLSRFSYSFFIIGGVLLYYIYKSQTEGPRLPQWQVWVIVIGGALAIAMGARGIREKHRQEK